MKFVTMHCVKRNVFGETSENPKTIKDFMREVLREQPAAEKSKTKDVKVILELKKPADKNTVADYDRAVWRAIFKKADYGMLTDAEIEKAVQGMISVGLASRDTGFNIENLRKEDKKPGAMQVTVTSDLIEGAQRAGQAVLRYQGYISEQSDKQKDANNSKVNQMLLDPLRLGGNTPVRWIERTLNVPRDLARQADKGEIEPFSAAGKKLGLSIAEMITGKEIPEPPTASENFQEITGVELPSIPEVKLERPFEYQSEKYKKEGAIGEEVGATAIDLFLLRRGIVGKPQAPQSLNLTIPLKNGTAAKISVVNAQTELDPFLARKVGTEISNNPVATRAYSQIQKQGSEVKLDFCTPPESSLFGRYTYGKNKVEVFMQNNGTAKEAVSTLVHESRHVKNRFLGKVNTQYDEYQAFRREFLYTEGRRPNFSERQVIWSRVLKDYSDLPMQKNPLINLIKEKK